MSQKAINHFRKKLDDQQARIVVASRKCLVDLPREAQSLTLKKLGFVSDHNHLIDMKKEDRMLVLWAVLIPAAVYVFDLIVMADAYDTFLHGKLPRETVIAMKFIVPAVFLILYVLLLLWARREKEIYASRKATSSEEGEHFPEVASSIMPQLGLILATTLKFLPIVAIIGLIFASRVYLFDFEAEQVLREAGIYAGALFFHVGLLAFGEKIVSTYEHYWSKLKLRSFENKKNKLEREKSATELTIRQDADRFYDDHADFGRRLPEAHANYRIRFNQIEQRHLQRLTAINWGVEPLSDRPLFPDWDKSWNRDGIKNGGSTGDSKSEENNDVSYTGNGETPVFGGDEESEVVAQSPVAVGDIETPREVAEEDFIERQTEVTA